MGGGAGEAAPSAGPAAGGQRRRPGGLETVVIATFGLFGLRTGFQPIHDNSAFLHLRTGINMVTSGHIPHSDPYSFTAFHQPWVIESWFAELLYGVAYRIGGLHLVVIEQGLIMAAVAVTIASLARAGSTIRTMAAAGIAMFAGWTLWAQRPLMFGLLGLALVMLVVERRRSPWWLLPIGWVWVNTHGSFPFGLLWLGAVYVGQAIDERRRPRELDRYIAAFAGSMVLAVVNPFGIKLLTFSLVVRSKQQVFARVVEWRSPNFQLSGELVCLVFFALALAILAHKGMPWRDGIAVVGFLALGLYSERNLAPAAVVLAPALGRALRRGPAAPEASEPAPEPTSALGTGPSLPSGRDPTRVFVAVIAVASLLFVAGVYRSSGLKLTTYPTGAEHYLATHGLLDGRHIATQDFVGDYRELIEGSHPTSRVFIDDRFDMYPVAVSNDYATLLGAGPASITVLDKWDIQVVMWARSAGLPGELGALGGWRIVYTDKGWVVLVRDPSVRPHPPH